MRRWTHGVGRAAAAAWMVWLLCQAPPVWGGPVPEADAAKIAAAAPTRPAAKPKRPRKLLVFSLCRDYRHAVIPHGVKALEVLGSKTGAYQAVVSDDIGMFEPEKIKQFDAICFNNTSGEVFLPKDFGKLPAAKKQAAKARDARLRKSLRDFIASGGGFAAIHCGMWCFRSWPEFAEIVGARFVSHPWHEKVAVKVDEPDHPLNAAFAGRGFEVFDEIYQFKEPYSRAKQRVLLSLDMTRTPDKGKRPDKDYGLSWVKRYGKGRVFYCAFGHHKELFMDPKIMRHYLAGIQFALGDLEADATPKGAAKAGPAPAEKKLFQNPETIPSGGTACLQAVFRQEATLAGSNQSHSKPWF